MAKSRARRPRLAYVVNSLNPGGTERLVVDMSKAFNRKYSVTVVCLDEPGPWSDDLRSVGIPVYCVWRQPGLDWSVSVRLARLFRDGQIELVHAHQCTAWFYSALARVLYSAPRLLLQEHGRFYPEILNRKRVWINKLLTSKLTHRYVAVCDDLRNKLVAYEGLDLAKIDVVYNGVSPIEKITADQRNMLRREFGFDEHDFVIGTVGRLDPIKNLPMLINAIADAHRTGLKVSGLIIGDGPEMNSLRESVESIGLGGSVKFAGFRRDARQLMQCLDVFVLCSLSEGASIALLEAMSANLPIIVTQVGGNSEIVVDETSGWVIPSGSTKSLVGAISDAARFPSKTKSIAAAGAQRFLQNFTFDLMLDRYHEIYGAILAARNNPK